MKRYLFPVAAILSLLSACSTINFENNFRLPLSGEFEGLITKVQIPVEPEYCAASFSTKVSISFQKYFWHFVASREEIKEELGFAAFAFEKMKSLGASRTQAAEIIKSGYREKREKYEQIIKKNGKINEKPLINITEELEVIGEGSVSKNNGSLKWVFRGNAINDNGKKYVFNSPMVELVTLTDIWGNLENFEFFSPLLSKTKTMSQDEYDKLFNEFKREQVQNNVPMLFKGKCITGDPIIRVKAIDISMYVDEPANILMPWIADIIKHQDLQQDSVAILAGWSYHQDKKVLVAKIDKEQKVRHPEYKDSSVSYKIKGYYFLDPITFLPIQSNLIITINFQTEKIERLTYTATAQSIFSLK